MGSVTAQRFMQVSEVMDVKSFTVKHLPATALYELAAPSTPPEIRERVESMLVDGEEVTTALIRKMKAEAKAAKDEADRLRRDSEKPKFQVTP